MLMIRVNGERCAKSTRIFLLVIILDVISWLSSFSGCFCVSSDVYLEVTMGTAAHHSKDG